MTTLNPYIYFNGNCEDAFNFANQFFDKRLHTLDALKMFQKRIDKFFRKQTKKFAHVSLPVSTETIFVSSDNMKAYIESITYNNFSLIIHTESNQLY